MGLDLTSLDPNYPGRSSATQRPDNRDPIRPRLNQLFAARDRVTWWNPPASTKHLGTSSGHDGHVLAEASKRPRRPPPPFTCQLGDPESASSLFIWILQTYFRVQTFSPASCFLLGASLSDVESVARMNMVLGRINFDLEPLWGHSPSVPSQVQRLFMRHKYVLTNALARPAVRSHSFSNHGPGHPFQAEVVAKFTSQLRTYYLRSADVYWPTSAFSWVDVLSLLLQRKSPCRRRRVRSCFRIVARPGPAYEGHGR